MPEVAKPEIKLFYCYAREDKELRDELEKHLSGLKRQYGLRNWHDREIRAGDDWQQAINQQLDEAHLILLLISPDFMASDYCYGQEMQRAFERQQEGTCRIIPIILRPTYWEDELFGQLQILPTDAVPVITWPHRDLAFHSIVKEMSIIFKDLLISLKTKKDWLNQGIALHALKQHGEALAAFEQALLLDPLYVEAYQEKGTTLYDLERYVEALPVFEEALALDEHFLKAAVMQGHTLHALQRYTEALSVFEKLIQRDPDQLAAYIGKEKVLRQLGVSLEAFEQLTRELQETRAGEEKAVYEREALRKKAVEQRDLIERLTKRLQEARQHEQEEQVKSGQLLGQREALTQQVTEQEELVGQLTKQLQEARQQVREEQGRAEQMFSEQEALEKEAVKQREVAERLTKQVLETRRLLAQAIIKVPSQPAGVSDLLTVPMPPKVPGYSLSLAVGTRSDPGIKLKHKPNEDSIFAYKYDVSGHQAGLFVVADGMGSHANGQEASRLAIQMMINIMLPHLTGGYFEDDAAFLKFIENGVQASNQAVHNRKMQAHAEMGTTITAALVIGAMAYVANVGDSRTYLYREGQGLLKITRDHSVAANLVDAGLLMPDDVYIDPNRKKLYRGLGAKPVVEIDTFLVDLQPGDKLMLCSAGLWHMMRDPVIQGVLSKTTIDPNKTSQDLIKAALYGGGEDNASVIVVQFAAMGEGTSLSGVQLLARPDTVTMPAS
ncbi:MAG TPA: TIR domain-containing protein [Ktedonobacteraceae bacterium]